MQKNKLYIAIAAVVVVVLVACGGFFVLSQKKTVAPVANDNQMQVLTLTPEAIGLTTAFRDDKKAMKFTIGNAKDMQAVEYQIAYTKEVKGEQVPEGLIGEVTMTPGASTAGIGYREFGTCSSGVCRYDTVVSAIQLTLKITKTDGKVYQVNSTVHLPQ